MLKKLILPLIICCTVVNETRPFFGLAVAGLMATRRIPTMIGAAGAGISQRYSAYWAHQAQLNRQREQQRRQNAYDWQMTQAQCRADKFAHGMATVATYGQPYHVWKRHYEAHLNGQMALNRTILNHKILLQQPVTPLIINNAQLARNRVYLTYLHGTVGA
jgi:hypothetical protein